MKLIHLSDLHLGRRVNEYFMLENQAYILKKIPSIIAEEKPKGVMIAGDIYEKLVPSWKWSASLMITKGCLSF